MSKTALTPQSRLRGLVANLSWKPAVDALCALVAGLGVGAILMAVFGYDPLKAYVGLYQGSFGNPARFADTLFNATPLVLTGLTFAIGVRAGLFNIGAQGQMLLGAIAVVAVGTLPVGDWIQPHALATVVHMTLALGAAMALGALYSLPAALLKITRGVHEVISTIMLNWIAVWLVRFLAVRVLADPVRAEKTISMPDTAQLATIVARSDLTHALWISLAFAVLIYWVLWHLPAGYGLRSTGLNLDATRYAGINPRKSMNLAFILGGCAAGLAGATQILGRPPIYAMYTDLSTLASFGFDGIAVALLGRNHPLGIIFGAVFFGALNAGTRMMQYQAQVPFEMARVIQGIIVLAVAIPALGRIVYGWFPKAGVKDESAGGAAQSLSDESVDSAQQTRG